MSIRSQMRWRQAPSMTPVAMGSPSGIDLLFGWGSTFGERAVDRVRLSWAIDVGIAGLIVPAVRASVALTVVEHLFVTLGADVRLNAMGAMLYATGGQSAYPGKNIFQAGVVYPGVTAAIGYGF